MLINVTTLGANKKRNMSELIKVEIRLITQDGHPGEWQWMGLLSKKSLKMLTANADTYSDFDTDERNAEL